MMSISRRCISICLFPLTLALGWGCDSPECEQNDQCASGFCVDGTCLEARNFVSSRRDSGSEPGADAGPVAQDGGVPLGETLENAFSIDWAEAIGEAEGMVEAIFAIRASARFEVREAVWTTDGTTCTLVESELVLGSVEPYALDIVELFVSEETTIEPLRIDGTAALPSTTAVPALFDQASMVGLRVFDPKLLESEEDPEIAVASTPPVLSELAPPPESSLDPKGPWTFSWAPTGNADFVRLRVRDAGSRSLECEALPLQGSLTVPGSALGAWAEQGPLPTEVELRIESLASGDLVEIDDGPTYPLTLTLARSVRFAVGTE